MTTEQAVRAPRDWKAIAAAFREPFPPEAIKQRAGRAGMQFDYIDARDVENRLDEVVGPAGWSDEYEVIDPARLGIKCRLTVLGVYKEGIGYPNNPLGSKGESDEPGKDAESDALKRAAVKFGIGRHLYEDKPRPNTAQTASDRPTGFARPTPTNGNVVDIRSVRARLKVLTSQLLKVRGKGETDKELLALAAQQAGVKDWPGMDQAGDTDVIKVGKWIKTQLDIKANSEEDNNY